jgi:polar amino acid transport system permease protein
MFDLAIFAQALPALGSAAIVTVELTIAACAVSLVAGTLSAAAQLGGGPVGYWASRSYVSLMRGTPLFVQLLVVYFGLPYFGIRGQAFLAASLAIGLNSGAYTTEILRAAILAVPQGQIDAAATIGLTWPTIWRRIILPQAVITSLPMLTAEFTIVLKSTPLASVIAVTELTYTGVLIQSRTFTAVEVFVTIAVGYILIAQLMMRTSRNLEGRSRQLRP